jgi:hypothetical protein
VGREEVSDRVRVRRRIGGAFNGDEPKKSKRGRSGTQRKERKKRTISFLVADDTFPASMKRSQATNHSSVVI